MAPLVGTVQIDYQALIQKANCLTFLGTHVGVYINSELDAKGAWTAHVLKTEDGKRSLVLSESSSTLAGALEGLHRKSAVAVNQYVTTNGFDAVPRMSSRSARPGKNRISDKAITNSLDESEVLSLEGDTTSSASSDDEHGGEDDEGSDSDASPDEGSLPQHQQGLGHGLGRVGAHRPHMAVRRPDPSSYCSPFRFSNERTGLPPPIQYRPPIGLPPQRPLPSPMSGNKPQLPPPPPPPPPPPLMLMQPQLPPYPRSASSLDHRLHALPPRVGAAGPVERPDNSGVLLCITWLGHGGLDVVDDCPLSVSYIQKRAIQLVRTRTADFRDAESVDLASTVLQARVRRLHVAGRVYELGNFRDNLGDLFASFPTFPRVEVEVASTPASPAKAPDSPSS